MQALNRAPLIERPQPEQQGTRLPIMLNNPEDMNEALRRLRRLNPTVGAVGSQKILTIERQSDRLIDIRVSDDAMAALAADAQDKMIEIIRRRLDPDGVSEIAITPQGDTRIVIEAPGEADPRRIKNILSQAGRMTFNMANTDPSAIRAAEATRPPLHRRRRTRGRAARARRGMRLSASTSRSVCFQRGHSRASVDRRRARTLRGVGCGAASGTPKRFVNGDGTGDRYGLDRSRQI